MKVWYFGPRCRGCMWACASRAFAGTLRTTGATPSITCTGGLSVGGVCQMCLWGEALVGTIGLCGVYLLDQSSALYL